MAIRFADFYNTPTPATSAPVVEDVSQPMSPNNYTGPKAAVVGSNHAAMAWLGLVIALVLLRIIYEMSE